MSEEEQMFVQYWYNTNENIFMMNELKDTLFKVWLEVCEKFKDYSHEDKWFRVGDYYKQRIIQGVKP